MVTDLEFIQLLDHLESGSPETSGTNRPLGRIARNTDALLDVLQASRLLPFSLGGGTISWNGSQLAWSSDITIPLASEVGTGVYNTISAGNVTLASGELAYVQLDRTTTGATVTVSTAASFAAYRTVVTGSADRLDFMVIAVREGTSVILFDGRRLRTGESYSNSGFTDTQYGQQLELTTVHDNQKENFRITLTGGGTLTWDEGTTTFTWSSDLIVEFPSSAGDNAITAGSKVITAGQVAYITLTRSPGTSQAKTLTAVANGSLPTGDDILVVATHNATDGRLYLWNGTALSDGDSVVLGGVQAGLQFYFKGDGTAVQVTDLTEGGTYPNRAYRVGTGQLMVYKNGVKAKASAEHWQGGTYPTGSMTGGGISNDDEYVEEDSGDGTGTRIIWLADGQAVAEPLYHAAATHDPEFEWPQADDYLEAFVGLQGEGPSPVESIEAVDSGDIPKAGGPLEGAVKLKEGTNVTLTHDGAGNAVVISASITAGVSSFEVSGGGQGAQTGAMLLIGGTGITLDDTTPGEVDISADVQDLEDLGDVSADLANAVKGAEVADATNVMVTKFDLMKVVGFDKIWTFQDDVLAVGGGALRLGDETYVHDTGSPLYIQDSDLYGSEVLSSSRWYGIYIGPGGTPGGSPVGVISRHFPNSTTGKYGVHPDDEDYAYIGCVYVDSSSKFRSFSKVDGRTVLGAGYDVTSAFSSFPSGSYVSVPLTALAQLEGPSPVYYKLRLLLQGDGTGRGDMSSFKCRGYSGFTASQTVYVIISDDDLAVADVEIPVGTDGGRAEFLISAVDKWDGVVGAWIVGFGDGRYSADEEMPG